MPNTKYHFILASASPRRKELLTAAGYKFDIVVSDVDESAFLSPGILPADFAAKAAMAKAKEVAKKFSDKLVIAADTIADYDGEIIGKPDSKAHAIEIVKKLFSKPHKIITAIAMVDKSRSIEMVQTDTTVIYPKKMTDAQIAAHIESKVWQGKAGAYSIQQGGDKFIERIDGSESNVVGLSMELLEEMLMKIAYSV